MSACSAESISFGAPIEATPTTTIEKRNLDRTLSTDRRVIAYMRRVNGVLSTARYYPLRVPSIESIARLLAPITAPLPVFDIEMAKKGYRLSVSVVAPAPGFLITQVRGAPRRCPWATPRLGHYLFGDAFRVEWRPF